MKKLEIELENCYGIKSIKHTFDFENRNKQKAYAIYAPNGLMKSSFTKTFFDLSEDRNPKEERFNRESKCIVNIDTKKIPKNSIYTVKAEIDIMEESSAMTDILVNPAHKTKYDELILDLDKKKKKILTSLQRQSKVKVVDIEKILLEDWNEKDLLNCLKIIKSSKIDEDMSIYKYAEIFGEQKVLSILTSQEFKAKAEEFNRCYQELFDQKGTIYRKGIFNPIKAEKTFETLKEKGYFESGHRIHFSGEENSIDKEELEKKLEKIHSEIDSDVTLKQIRRSLAQDTKTHALAELIERLTPSQIANFLNWVKAENQGQFRRDLWSYYVHQAADLDSYLDQYEESKDDIEKIENEASEISQRWNDAIERFNNRFVDMPFRLSVANQQQVVLREEAARLKFVFKEEEEEDSREWSLSEAKKTLSQGERRAVYLLNFIFEVEARKLSTQETLFIIDDIADSFDYKNKHAIIQYLRDLNKIDHFYQIILTHNFDFFRALVNSHVVSYDRCLMANKKGASIELESIEGIRNYFSGVMKKKMPGNNSVLCATIPFTRNLIEYTKGEEDPDYIKLTSLLHWKINTDKITIGEYLKIYNELFVTNFEENDNRIIIEVLFEEAKNICNKQSKEGLNLEDKILLSIAIRLSTEIFIINKLRAIKRDQNYWFSGEKQFGRLCEEFKKLYPQNSAITTLEKVSVTVSSNIHVNSFMYEPILDLTIGHLINLYEEVEKLKDNS